MQKHSQLTCELTIMSSCPIKVKKKRIYGSNFQTNYDNFLQNSCIIISKMDTHIFVQYSPKLDYWRIKQRCFKQEHKAEVLWSNVTWHLKKLIGNTQKLWAWIRIMYHDESFGFACSTKINLPSTILPFNAFRAFSASISDLYETKPKPLGLWVFWSVISVASVSTPNGENNDSNCCCVV